MAVGSNQIDGPRLRALDAWLPGRPSPGRAHQLLSDEQRARLAALASIVRFKKGEQVYAEGEPTTTIFNVIDGVMKISKLTPDGGAYVPAFLYPGDLFGLSEEGRYVNSANAITPVVAYSLRLDALKRHLSKDADLQFQIITKLCHELREVQRHALLLTQKHALSKLAMFLQLQEHIQSTNGVPLEIYLPMDRSDIAEFVSMSPAAVSRGFRSLVARGVIKFRDHRHLEIVDRKAFGSLAGNSGRKWTAGRRATRPMLSASE
jgi:CRP-like cAMP-binding protein